MTKPVKKKIEPAKRYIEIEFIYNSDLENKVEDFMKRADLLRRSDKMGIVRRATYTTTNKLPLAKYRKLIEKGFEDGGGVLLSMKELSAPPKTLLEEDKA